MVPISDVLRGALDPTDADFGFHDITNMVEYKKQYVELRSGDLHISKLIKKLQKRYPKQHIDLTLLSCTISEDGKMPWAESGKVTSTPIARYAERMLDPSVESLDKLMQDWNLLP